MKTTKKLISIFLSLLMVLSLIPIGAMSASAAEYNFDTNTINGSFKLTLQPKDVVNFNVKEDTGITIYTELEGGFGDYVTDINEQGEFVTKGSWTAPSNGTLSAYEKDTVNGMPLWNLLFTAKCPNGHEIDIEIEPIDTNEDRCIVYCKKGGCNYHSSGFEYNHIPGICPYCYNEKLAPPHTCSLGSKITGQAAECSVDGWNDYYQCTDATCGKIYATNNTDGTAYDDLDAWKASTAGKINELGHDWGTTPTYGYGAKYHWEVCSRDASHAQNREAHSGGTATCQAKAVCSTCNQEYGDYTEHSYTNYVSDKNATCTKDGTKTAACDYECGTTSTITDNGTATGHSFTIYVSDKNATCTADGTKTAACDNKCGTTDTIADKGTATGHTYTSAVTTPATCTKDGVRTYTCSCGDTYNEPITMIGHSYTSDVTKKPTFTADGVRTFTCANCNDAYTESIARLKVTADVKYNSSTKMSAGFKLSATTKNVSVKWGKVADADGYIVYAAYCGKDAKAIKTIKGADAKSYSFTKLDGKKIDLKKNLKVYVVAYKTIDGKKVEFGKSIVGHVVGGQNKTYTNPTKVTVKKDKVTLSAGKTATIKATVTYKHAEKKQLSDKHAAEKRYRSSNKDVATVDANGKITAVGKGTCTIYVFAKNGNAAKVTVTVK